jgi:hypothetical protein
MYICAVLGDRLHLRGPFILGNALLIIIGLPLLGFADNVGARYFGVFLATTGCNANVPCVLTYQANNIRGQWVGLFPRIEISAGFRLTCDRNVPSHPQLWSDLVVLGVSSGRLSSVARTPQVMFLVSRLASCTKQHILDIWTTLIYQSASGLVIVITLMLEFKFWRANKRADAGGKIIAGLEGTSPRFNSVQPQEKPY